ncbi:hypothetical protein BBP40_011992 [Aspergillus hancockii]|nr:hypothetical protein BBP40_011992 [Aspergillus hancockii]
MSGLPRLDGRQDVQQQPAPFAHANDRLASKKPSSSLKQHSSHSSGDRVSHSPSSVIPARAATEPASAYTLRGASSQPFSPTSLIDAAFRSREEPSSTEHQTRQTHSSPSIAKMRPKFTQLAIGETADRKQTGSSRLVSGVHYNGSTAVPEPLTLSAGHKRTATGFVKPSADDHPYSSSVNGAERRRSKSIGSTAHGNRIAALSVHLRTRLSYAAAKIEQTQRSHGFQNTLPSHLLQSDRSPSVPTIEPPECIQHGRGSLGLTEVGTPNRTTSMPAPDPLPRPHSYSLNGPTRLSPVHRSEHSLSSSHEPPKLHTPLSSLASVPRLAPPADIIPRNDSTRRRRPNPNNSASQQLGIFYPRHRRHHSQQSLSTIKRNSSSESVLVPETPPLRPTEYRASTPHNGLSSQRRQNSSMEQDAIETLLFMSSPGHSGHCSNSQPSQSQKSRIHSSMTSTHTQSRAPRNQPTHVDTGTNQSLTVYRSPVIGLEAQAGDEIDRILDQMDSDSEDEKSFPSRPSKALGSSSMPSGNSHGRNGRFRP